MTTKCDVCKINDSVGVVASTLGPVSNAICRTCLNKRAEFVGMFGYIYDEIGTEVADHVKASSTFIDGKYVTWDEWVETKKNG